MNGDSFKTSIDGKKLLWIIEILAIAAGIIWMAAFLRSDINTNTEWNKRQDEQIESHKDRARGTYVRKDVAQQRYQNLMDKLDRMDKKLDRNR